MSRTRKLAAMTYEEAQSVLTEGCVALLPCGATEAHGPHLPLSTDVIISEHGALHAANLLDSEGIPALVLPPLGYAVTEFASGFEGTISLPIETATAMIRDVVLGAVRTGFSGVVLCNAHLEPGNIQALRAAMAQARETGALVEFPDVTRKPHALRLGEEFKSGACHAGRYEGSLVMAAREDLVRTDVAAKLPPNPESLSETIRAGKSSFEEAGGPQAYFGYPADASVKEGNALYLEMADIFASGARTIWQARAT